MALDNGYNVNKQLPHYPDAAFLPEATEFIDEDDWSMEKVTQWLETHGWGSVAPLFELNGIQGQTFLNLTMAQLAQVIPRADLAYGDKRRLLHGIHSIQGNQRQQQQQQQHSQTDEKTMPAHYLDTSQHQQPEQLVVTTPTSYSDAPSMKHQQYASPISTMPSRTAHGPTSSQVPQLSYPIPQGSTSSTSSTSSSDSNVSSLLGPSPITTTSTPSTMESEYAKIRPYIPERKSSNPAQISKIMKQFNVPPTLVSGIVTRSNPINSRRPNNNGHLQYSHHPSYPQQPPISPRQASGDMNGGWKISRRPGISKPKQDPPQQPPAATVREQRIQVTLDSDTFFSLTVTGMHDPLTLKAAIVKKLGLASTFLDQYQFYHENGDNSDTPLEDDQLVYICGHSDNSKHRILLKSTAPPTVANYSTESPTSSPSTSQPQQQHYHHQQQPQQQQTASLWAVPPRQHQEQQVEAPPSAALWAVPPQSVQQTTPKEEKPDVSLWAVPPRPIEQQPSAALWAVPPRTAQQPTPQEEEQPSAPLWAVPPQPIIVTTSTSSPLWAIPPRPVQDTNSPTTTSPSSSSSSSLWAVPPRPLKDTTPTAPSPSASLWAVPPKQQQASPTPSPSSSSSTTASSTTTKTPASAASSLWAVPPKSTDQKSGSSNDTLSSGLWAVPPRMSPSNSSSTSAAHDSMSSTNDNTSAMSMSITPPSTDASSCLWAVPPQHHRQQPPSTSGGSTALDPMEGLTLVDPPVTLPSSLSPSPPSSTSSPSLRPALVSPPKSSTSTPRAQKRLQIQIPSTTRQNHDQPTTYRTVESPQSSSSPNTTTAATTNRPPPGYSPSAGVLQTPQSSSENGSPVYSSSQEFTDTEEENWAERPSIEQLYKDIDKYLPGHDLDKEIMLEGDQAASGTPPPSASNTPSPPQQQQQQAYQQPPRQQPSALPLTRRLQGHKKSIRVVAKEAHRNWRQAVNVIRVNNILRRRSTKMWGHKVQQVKPGMALANDKDDTPTTMHDGKPAPTKLQWMRGQLIGKGSYGRVYHALNVAAGEWIAVKQVDIPTTSSDRHNQQLHDTADALYREIQLLKDLEHDNIVQYLGYDVDQEEGHINIFLEYVPGGSIASCLSKQGKFDEPLVSYFTRQILLGLEYLHDRNILHRDIKAGNVLLTHTGTCKITDFGLSKLSGQDQTAYDTHGNNSVMRGTVFWMAPEVVAGTNYNAKVDIWSLGCTVIEMLTGKHPWLDMNMLAALYSLGQFEAPPIPENIHDNAKSFLKLCFTINPEERPTAADLLVHPFVSQNPSFKFKDHTKQH